VRLVGPDGQQIGVKPLPEALDFARSLDLDLVEVAPDASPPVCRIMDHGKYKYEQDQRRKDSRKKASHVAVKEMKFRPKISGNDYTTKMKHVERFLAEGNRVKLTIMFRGREVSHPELGKRILDRVAEDVNTLGVIEHFPRIDGRNMTMVLAPVKDGARRRKPATSAPAATAAATAPVEDTAVEDTAVEDTAVEGPAVEGPAVEDTAVEDTAVEDTADTTVDDREPVETTADAGPAGE
jgi:translation initiation factor IF-3